MGPPREDVEEHLEDLLPGEHPVRAVHHELPPPLPANRGQARHSGAGLLSGENHRNMFSVFRICKIKW